MNAIGTNTAQSTSVMAMIGLVTSRHGADGGVVRREAVLDVALDVLDHDDGVIDHDADGQHEAEERERVDREAEDDA